MTRGPWFSITTLHLSQSQSHSHIFHRFTPQHLLHNSNNSKMIATQTQAGQSLKLDLIGSKSAKSSDMPNPSKQTSRWQHTAKSSTLAWLLFSIPLIFWVRCTIRAITTSSLTVNPRIPASSYSVPSPCPAAGSMNQSGSHTNYTCEPTMFMAGKLSLRTTDSPPLSRP